MGMLTASAFLLLLVQVMKKDSDKNMSLKKLWK
jgi:hypothetical protein